jgi:hypothetical protein
MSQCPVCGNSTQKTICENCDWPLNMADAASLQSAINWAYHMYRRVLRLEAQLGTKPTKPLSEMNVQLVESPTDLVEPLRAEIKTLTNGMEVIAKEQDEHAAEIRKLSEQLQNVLKLFHDNKEKVDAAFQKQFIENKKIYSQQHSLSEISNQHTHTLNDMNAGISVAPPAIAGSRGMAEIRANGRANADNAANPQQSLPATISEDRQSPSDEDLIVSEYNRKVNEVPLAWREQFMSVTLDPGAFLRLRDGNDSNIVFNRDRKGNYLILPQGGYCYLVPNKQRKITAQIYTTTKAIYDCTGYSEGYREFYLVKPALVAEESADCWRLSRKGTLQFM